MAGSKKGERRGGAKGGRPKGSETQTKFNPKKGVTPPRRKKGARNLMTQEREREMYTLVTGANLDLMPREAMLSAMRYFYQTGMEYQQILLANLRAVPRDDAHAKTLDEAVIAAEYKVREYLVMASDIAYKVAPYIHPRLAALAVTTDRNTSKDLFDALLEEIDQGPRMRVVHDVRKKDEAAA